MINRKEYNNGTSSNAISLLNMRVHVTCIKLFNTIFFLYFHVHTNTIWGVKYN